LELPNDDYLATVLTIFSSIVYGLSLINMGVSLLLLIGIARVSKTSGYYCILIQFESVDWQT